MDIIAIMGMDELSDEDKLTVSRARKVQRFFSQPLTASMPSSPSVPRTERLRAEPENASPSGVEILRV